MMEGRHTIVMVGDARFTVSVRMTQTYILLLSSLNGTHFDLNNRTLYDKFKSLVVDGPEWIFIKKFDKSKDGHGAVLP